MLKTNQAIKPINIGQAQTISHINSHQAQWLLAHGISVTMLIGSTTIMSCRGERAKDGRFDENPDGPEWIAFEEDRDWVFWQPLTGEIATDTGRAFALGEELIDNPATTAFEQHLIIYADVLEWLQHERRGIVVVKWNFAFDRLRHLTSIAVSEPVLATYRHHMRPPHMPKLFVLPKAEGNAA